MTKKQLVDLREHCPNPMTLAVCERYAEQLTGPDAMRVTHYTPLIPAEDCRSIMRELDAADRPMGNDAAAKQARILIGSYPAREVHDPDTFVRAITSVLAEAPLDIGRMAVDHITRTLKWLPTRADVAQVVEHMQGRRKVARMVAQRHLDEHKRRNDNRGHRYSDLTPEQRAEFDAHLERIKSRGREAAQA